MKIKRENIDPYFMNPVKEKRLWENAIFVFDSSVILDFYFLHNQTRDKIYKEVFKELPDRLLIPSHVEFEFLKNRKKIIGKPISEKYNPLKTKIQNLGKSFISDIKKRIDEISRETTKDDNHPHINQIEINHIKTQTDEFKDELKKFKVAVLNRIKNVEKEILDVKDIDDVLKAIEDHFLFGEEYSFTRVLEITKEREHRYQFEIPPGYSGLNQNDKKGTQIFGDLIIWNQILDFSREKDLPIVFITNDIKKDEDLCYLDKNAAEDRIERPREGLIKEIRDHADVEFWLYNLPQFLYHANEYLEAKLEEVTIQNIAQLLNTKEQIGEYLKFECSSCGKIHSYHESECDLDFECIECSERNMGFENHHEAVEHFNCDCGKEVSASFSIWEYPVGIHNCDSVELEGAKVLESFYSTIDFFEDEYEPDLFSCDICTGNRDQMGNMVEFYSRIELINEYDDTHVNHKYSSVIGRN